MNKMEKIYTPEQEKPKIYKVGDVMVADNAENVIDEDGVECVLHRAVKGVLYRFSDTNEEAGVLTNSVGSLGDSTGIFADMMSPSVEEIADIVSMPENANMTIPQKYKEIEERYRAELNEKNHTKLKEK